MQKVVVPVLVSIGVLVCTSASAQSRSHPYPSYNPPAYYYGTGSNPRATYVAPTVRRDGTFVRGHARSRPNGTQLDNWSTRGNVNPYTGRKGTRKAYR